MKKILILSNLLFLISYFSFSQNVGIGTPTPAGKLQVNHRSFSFSPSLVIFDSSTSSAGRIKFQNAGGNRFWQISTIVNNAIPSGQYMDIVTDSLWIMTLRGNGNVGIGNLTPAERLDVNGNINLSGVLKINGSAGTAGQVLTSNGTGDPQWKNTAYNNNSRFAANIPLITGTGDLTYSSLYNLTPADVTISGSTITINKSGLWHFEGSIYNRISWTTPSSDISQSIDASFSADGVTYIMIQDGPMEQDPLFSPAYTKTFSFSYEVYISAPATVRVSRHITLWNSALTPTRTTQGVISGYLISE